MLFKSSGIYLGVSYEAGITVTCPSDGYPVKPTSFVEDAKFSCILKAGLNFIFGVSDCFYSHCLRTQNRFSYMVVLILLVTLIFPKFSWLFLVIFSIWNLELASLVPKNTLLVFFLEDIRFTDELSLTKAWYTCA